MTEQIASRAKLARRASHALDRAEAFYLKVLRAMILIIATLLLAYAAWLAAYSLYKISRTTESVVEAQASVAADEITDAATPETPSTSGTKPVPNLVQQRYYNGFVGRYYQLYRGMFEPYRQAEDKQLTRAEFDGAFIDTQARLQAIKSGDINFEQDKADLETLLGVMTEAAGRPVTIDRLKRYKAARKVQVTKQIERTRVDYVSGWDSTSVACSDWYQSPVGCPVRRPVETPYVETVQVMEFPKGTQSQTQIFKAFQDRYYGLLGDRRSSNAVKAKQAREDILSGIAEGRISLVTALQIVGGFLVLMFFFLLIAIERHQRRLAASKLETMEAVV